MKLEPAALWICVHAGDYTHVPAAGHGLQGDDNGCDSAVKRFKIPIAVPSCAQFRSPIADDNYFHCGTAGADAGEKVLKVFVE